MGEARSGGGTGVLATRGDPEVAAAVSAYLRLTHGDPLQALNVAVADGIAVSRLVSTGFARLRQPTRRTGTLAPVPAPADGPIPHSGD